MVVVHQREQVAAGAGGGTLLLRSGLLGRRGFFPFCSGCRRGRVLAVRGAQEGEREAEDRCQQDQGSRPPAAPVSAEARLRAAGSP
ncbi:hypothetical protein [Rubrobacter taiwanensis]|uniref:hypothetical protein n=1 Tax=Rubrobacter taiwanensis TaxID=185139 RepID=UPI001A9E1ECF|nr:hypothetical protein [Rubrobacter taiwanensis]